MGPFAGWDMPMIYKGVSIPDSVKVSLEFKCDRESKIQTSNYFQLRYDSVTIITWFEILSNRLNTG